MNGAIFDTNLFISALISPAGVPAQIVAAALAGRCELIAHAKLLDELREVTRNPKIAARITSAEAGRLVNEFADVATFMETLPNVERSPDPRDDFLLALAEAAAADFLVTGDKADLLVLATHKGTKIVTARAFHTFLGL